MKTIAIATALAATLGLTSAAHAAVLSFDEKKYSAGDIVTSFSDGPAPRVSGSVMALRNVWRHGKLVQVAADAMVFDTDDYTGGDDDLAAPFYRNVDGTKPTDGLYPGNVLIISEDGDTSDPDDNGLGGIIKFTFDMAVDFTGFRVFDDVKNFVAFSDKGDRTAGINVPEDNMYKNVRLDWKGVREITFDFGRASGAIDNLRFEVSAVPVPASLPLLLAGVAGFGLMRRRRKG